MSRRKMGKIEALKIVNQEIIDAVRRIEQNTLRPNREDIFFLTDKYNECNTSHYTHKEVATCGDCRRYMFEFWKNVVNGKK